MRDEFLKSTVIHVVQNWTCAVLTSGTVQNPAPFSSLSLTMSSADFSRVDLKVRLSMTQTSK